MAPKASGRRRLEPPTARTDAPLAPSSAATGRPLRLTHGAVRASPCNLRAGQVPSRYVRLPGRPERDRLCKSARAAHGHDAGRASQAEDEGGVSR